MKLQKAEWDFRGVHQIELLDAILWEYARESEKVKGSAAAWLSEIIDADAIGAHLKRFDFFCMPAHPGRAIEESGLARFNLEFFTMLCDFPEFPAPWTKLRRAVDKDWKPRRVFVQSPARFSEDYAHFEKNGWAEYFQRRHLSFSIDWDRASVDEIVEEIEKAVRKEGTRHADETRPKNRKGAEPWHLLKRLAALRFDRAGFTYNAAQDFIVKNSTISKAVKKGESDDRKILPLYSQSKWSNAINAAAKMVAEVEKRICPKAAPAFK